jgi:hypothetical protein
MQTRRCFCSVTASKHDRTSPTARQARLGVCRAAGQVGLGHIRPDCTSHRLGSPRSAYFELIDLSRDSARSDCASIPAPLQVPLLRPRSLITALCTQLLSPPSTYLTRHRASQTLCNIVDVYTASLCSQPFFDRLPPLLQSRLPNPSLSSFHPLLTSPLRNLLSRPTPRCCASPRPIESATLLCWARLSSHSLESRALRLSHQPARWSRCVSFPRP